MYSKGVLQGSNICHQPGDSKVRRDVFPRGPGYILDLPPKQWQSPPGLFHGLESPKSNFPALKLVEVFMVFTTWVWKGGQNPIFFHGLLGATLVCFLYTNLTSKQLQELWLWHVPHVEAQASTNEFHKFVPPIGAVEKTHRAPRNQLIFMEVFPSLFCKVNFQDIWMNEESWGFGL